MKVSDAQRAAIAEVFDEFFLLTDAADASVATLDAVASNLKPSYQRIIASFQRSLSGAVSTVGVPFSLASASAHFSHWQRIHSAERIRSLKLTTDELKPGEQYEAARDRVALEKARGRLDEFLESDEGQNAIAVYTSEFLGTGLRHGLEAPARELLRQGLVLVWSAYEVLCRDTFECLLNEDPGRVVALMNHPTTRKRFDAEKFSLETLVQHGFDLSARLGSVLLGQQDFSIFPTVKSVYAVLYPDRSDLRETFGDRNLWTLYQRRHVIVHRGGKIDQDYLDATGEALVIGTELIVKPADFETALSVVVAAGCAMARALA